RLGRTVRLTQREMRCSPGRKKFSGVSVVPEMAVEPRAHCSFIPLSDEKAVRRVAVVQTKQHFRSGVHRAFLKYLQARHQTKMLRPLHSCPIQTIKKSSHPISAPERDKIAA